MKEKQQFTKGEWTVSLDHDYADTYFIRPSPTFGESYYNSKLISQSPKLLDLLQECILQLDKYRIPDTSEELTSLVSRSKQAINLALGE